MRRKYISGLVILLLASCLTGCRQEQKTESDSTIPETTEAVTDKNTDAETEETQPLTNAPFPKADINAHTFDDGEFRFVEIINDDDTCAEGMLSVENLDGNFMLKFTDTSTNADNLEEAVQKISISVDQLLNPDQLESVSGIGFDIYAQAKDKLFRNDDGEYLQVAGWIGGGGGTVCADGNWYGFGDFAVSGANEYDLERSDAYHVEFKFLLAESGKCWSSSMEDVNFSIMRWGMQNISDLYLDNIVFYDAEGNTIPMNPSYSENNSGQEEVS